MFIHNGYKERLTIIEQKIIYRKLHGMYKKALNRALQNNSNLEQLINLLKESVEGESADSDDNQDDDTSNKENSDPSELILQNLKKTLWQRTSIGNKRFKSSSEATKPKLRNQRHCKRCGKIRALPKNCR